MRQGRRFVSTAVLATVTLVLIGPATAHAWDLRDRVLDGPTTRGMRIAAHASSRTYLTATGGGEPIQVSRSPAADSAADQELVDFLGSLPHGGELRALRLHVAPPEEIAGTCGGGGVVACYAIQEGRIYLPAHEVAGIPIEYVLAHEYGHHVAAWRSNAPWDAVDWGPKRWSSAMRVCTHVRRGTLFPGDQGAHYRDDPGEGFADSYAHLAYPSLRWHFNELLRPTEVAFDAIRKDILRPWTAPRTRTFRGRFGPGRGARTFNLRLRLDGDVQVALEAARAVRAEVELRTQDFATAETLRASGRFGAEWCRHRPVERVKLIVRRRAGAGPFALRVSWPG